MYIQILLGVGLLCSFFFSSLYSLRPLFHSSIKVWMSAVNFLFDLQRNLLFSWSLWWFLFFFFIFHFILFCILYGCGEVVNTTSRLLFLLLLCFYWFLCVFVLFSFFFSGHKKGMKFSTMNHHHRRHFFNVLCSLCINFCYGDRKWTERTRTATNALTWPAVKIFSNAFSVFFFLLHSVKLLIKLVIFDDEQYARTCSTYISQPLVYFRFSLRWDWSISYIMCWTSRTPSPSFFTHAAYVTVKACLHFK